uniref:Sel1 repeat family protein n=2 Tax=Aureoumbra lagunensis TaxID=44058 RepID=A0A7S3JXJ6_9STRA|mmetsp:Transcript_5238/g.7381  ORF Transcript_5238/g.7381 Transcript_5238/m.7381 type:complete len:246 (-) Transcript_5238:150-887(-)
MLEKNVLELDHTNEKELKEKNPNTPCPFCGEIVADELAKIEDRVKLNPTSDVQALYVLGYTRIYGCKNSCRRPIEGCSLLEKATRFGNYEALYELGVATRDGNSGKADAAKAARIFRVAAAQGGNAKALYELGLAYLQGHGVDKDTTEAARLLDLGARENYDPCKKALANLFIDGNDLAQDRVKAAQLLGLHQTAEILKKGIEPPPFLFKQEAAVNVNDDSSTVPPSCEYTEAEMDEFFAEEDAD